MKKRKYFEHRPISSASFTLPNGEPRSITYLYDLNGIDTLHEALLREYGIGVERVTHINEMEVG